MGSIKSRRLRGGNSSSKSDIAYSFKSGSRYLSPRAYIWAWINASYVTLTSSVVLSSVSESASELDESLAESASVLASYSFRGLHQFM